MSFIKKSIFGTFRDPCSSQLASSGRPCTRSRRGSRSGWPASRSSWGWWWSARPASQHSCKNMNIMQTGVYYFALPIFCVWTCKTCFDHWASVFQPASRRTCSRRRWRRRPGRGLPGSTRAVGCQSLCSSGIELLEGRKHIWYKGSMVKVSSINFLEPYNQL